MPQSQPSMTHAPDNPRRAPGRPGAGLGPREPVERCDGWAPTWEQVRGHSASRLEERFDLWALTEERARVTARRDSSAAKA